MVPNRHVDMLFWESPEKVGIPEFRGPRLVHIYCGVRHLIDLTWADQLYRESVDGSFREKAVELVQPLLPLAPGMNGAARSGERSRLSDGRVGICGRCPSAKCSFRLAIPMSRSNERT
jgi:hypothetical protein